MNNKGNLKKVCSFCVSDWHFVTMLIPYIHKKVESKEEVKIYTQQNQFEIVKVFLSKLALNQEMKQKLANFNWNESKITKYYQIEKELSEIANKKITCIIKGDESYIKKANEYIEKWATKQSREITVVNCYEVMQFNQNMEEILNKHEKVLNTSGEKEIEEVFEGYHKKSDIEGVS